MISRKTQAAAVAAALLSCMGWHNASAQVAGKAYVGRIYALHTAAVGACPALDWNIVVGPNHTLSGVVGANDMEVLFRVTGTYAADGSFHLEGTEVGGTRTGAVDGQIQRRTQSMMATLGGMGVDSPCQGKTVYVRPIPPYNPYQAAAGLGVMSGGG
jgi:hypothetical protein